MEPFSPTPLACQGRIEFKLGTWLDREELAYPEGSLRQSERFARALCPDGKVRKCKVGIPDTFFSIPARMYALGKTVAGYVTINSETEVLEFRPYKNCKNWTVFERKEKE